MYRKLTASHVLIAIIVLLIGIRMASVPFSPPGFFLDEAASGAHVVAMLHHGTNAHQEAWPLFSASLGGGYTTPIYLYPLTGWAAVFGPSELSLRLFSQVSTIAAILILALAMKWWVGKRGVLAAAIVGLALPWGWLQGSLAWDPALVPLFVAISFLGFTWLFHASSLSQKKISYFLLPLSLLALAYLYPPCRVSAPLLFIGAYWLLYIKRRVSIRAIFITCLAAAVIATPLFAFMLEPEALDRSKQLSVFYSVGIFEGIFRAIGNLLLLLNPVFLFITGDPNLRHSTAIAGMLGVGAFLPLLALAVYIAKKRPRITLKTLLRNNTQLLVIISIFCSLAGLLGSALTNEGQPHSLRATAAWPFLVILLTLGWMILVRHFKKRTVYAALGIFMAATLLYVGDLIVLYPQRAAESFDGLVRQKIYSGQQVIDYPSLSLEYYKNK